MRPLLLAANLSALLGTGCLCSSSLLPEEPDDCPDGGCALSCDPPLTDCDGECVDLDAEDRHCGDCAVECRQDEICVLGGCTCPDGETECDEACVATATDPDHCGGCGIECPGGISCTAGVCDCAADLTFCTPQCVNTDTDPSNCGECGVECDRGQRRCQDGECLE